MDRSARVDSPMERLERRRPRTLPARPLVLIIVADDDTRELYCAALEAFGFETVAGADGADAFRSAWEIHPDCHDPSTV
jgi:hypothetical protein